MILIPGNNNKTAAMTAKAIPLTIFTFRKTAFSELERMVNMEAKTKTTSVTNPTMSIFRDPGRSIS